MKKTVLFCLTLLVLPAFMADAGNAALTQSEKRYCQRKAEKYADEKSLGTTAGGAIAGALAGGIIGGAVDLYNNKGLRYPENIDISHSLCK